MQCNWQMHTKEASLEISLFESKRYLQLMSHLTVCEIKRNWESEKKSIIRRLTFPFCRNHFKILSSDYIYTYSQAWLFQILFKKGRFSYLFWLDNPKANLIIPDFSDRSSSNINYQHLIMINAQMFQSLRDN